MVWTHATGRLGHEGNGPGVTVQLTSCHGQIARAMFSNMHSLAASMLWPWDVGHWTPTIRTLSWHWDEWFEQQRLATMALVLPEHACPAPLQRGSW